MTPGAGAEEASDPFLKARLFVRFRGRELRLLAPHAVFSSQRIDAGTRLLLDHLPAGEPASFLDLGCGYGALGLPLAAAFPGAHALLADRDLLAIEYARRNAERSGLTRVEVVPSLGYGGLPPAARFDWILLNAPARAGERVLELFIAGARRRLQAGGEMRLVIIRPLAAVVEAVAARVGTACARVAEGTGHVVFAVAPGEGADLGEEAYLRDAIEVELPEPLRLERPTDLADEPGRLEIAVPLLASHLPQQAPARALAFRAGYGLLPALLLARYPGAAVVAQDRDLLAAAFTRRNGAAAGAGRLEVVASVAIADAAASGPFDLVVGESSPPLGRRATLAEFEEARRALAPGGRALIAGLAKHWDESLAGAAPALGLEVIARRGAVALYGMQAARG